ncbi:unnamed protein product [Blepharisma stoltei]|uniref:EF-hand domain-containing protein n=1 Tax=Blepharisma stoltei TaxID=1481888 RepID=A0AAU9IGX7_9CILI|nr:unnamed protein product [Blepharisma stoltei]
MDFETRKNAAELQAKEKEFEKLAAKANQNLRILYQRIRYVEEKCYLQNNEKCLSQIENYWLTLNQLEREESKRETIIQQKCEEEVPLHIKMLDDNNDSIVSKEEFDAYKNYWDCTSASRENLKNFTIKKANVLNEAFMNLKQYLPQKPS